MNIHSHWHRTLRLGAAAALTIFTIPASAALAQEETDLRIAALETLSALIRGESTIPQIQETLEQWFWARDEDGGGYGPSDVARESDRRAARIRSQKVSGWLIHDLDGDGIVTEEEVRRSLLPQARMYQPSATGVVPPTEEQIARRMERLVAHLDLPDDDRDGRTTLDEMRRAAASAAEAEKLTPGASARRVPAPAFDADGDGTVTREEFLEAVMPVVREFDVDGDRTISKPEVSALLRAKNDVAQRAREQQRAARIERDAERAGASCPLPAPGPADALAVVAIEEGTALPTVSLGGDGTVTTYGEIEIAPASRPTYVVVHAESPMIVRFTGAVQRIERVVSLGEVAGFVGIRAEKVLRPKCDDMAWMYHGPQANAARQFFEAATGRKPDQFAHIYRFGHLRLPAGPHRREFDAVRGVEPDLDGPAGPVWQRFLAFRPGGLVHVTPDSVVSEAMVTRYRVLPQEAGLARLVEQGVLDLVDPGRHDERLEAAPGGGVRFRGITIQGGGGNDTLADGDRIFVSDPDGGWFGGQLPRFRIRAATALPAGMARVHGAIFELPRGVAAPTGDLDEVRIERE